jgi:hypothetical protein
MIYLSPDEMLRKFPFLEKYKNQKWLEQNTIDQKINFKEIPLQCTFVLIEELLNFIERTKFNSHYEEYLSTKVRLRQIKELLHYFCEDSEEEKTKKGTNL